MNNLQVKFLLSAAVISIISACSDPRPSGADQVFSNAAVYTADENRSRAEAVAISSGEIVFVGINQPADAFIGANTKVLDLDGKTVSAASNC